MAKMVLAVAVCGLLSLILSGCGGGGGDTAPAIEGYYTSPNFKAGSGSFAGLHVVSTRKGNDLSDDLIIAGTDDGTTFWNIEGKWTDKGKGEFIAYYSHRNGDLPPSPPFKDRMGTIANGVISWNNTNQTLAMLSKPSFQYQAMHVSKEDYKVGGFYLSLDKNATFPNKTDGWKGTRIVGANYFPKVSIVGTDDGTTFWHLEGHWAKKEGQFSVDCTSIGGAKNTTGAVGDDMITWKPGDTIWKKLAMVQKTLLTVTV